jgi:serine/threonine protein kinase
VAKRVETAGITSAGGFVGSFHYAAPEQVLGRATSAATDVYALTVVLYQCLTGAVPYARYAEAGALFAQVNEPPPSLSRTEARAFNDVIARGMAKDPADRYASAGELIVAAVRSLGELPSGRLRQRPVFLVGSGDGDRDFETERRPTRPQSGRLLGVPQRSNAPVRGGVSPSLRSRDSRWSDRRNRDRRRWVRRSHVANRPVRQPGAQLSAPVGADPRGIRVVWVGVSHQRRRGADRTRLGWGDGGRRSSHGLRGRPRWASDRRS